METQSADTVVNVGSGTQMADQVLRVITRQLDRARVCGPHGRPLLESRNKTRLEIQTLYKNRGTQPGEAKAQRHGKHKRKGQPHNTQTSKGSL